MKMIFVQLTMKIIRTAVVAFERKLKISISRYPLEKFYGDFIDQANLDLVSQSHGVLHIGAHLGIESHEYGARGKPVLWVEADPETFQQLEKNLKAHDNQSAYNLLLGDQEKIVDFFRASNGSQSSSIFQFSNLNSFKDVSTTQVFPLSMCRLDSKFTPEEIGNFDHWVVDVQGAELLVLKGAGQLLNLCRTLFIECSKSEYYLGGTQWEELSSYLSSEGFRYFTLPKNITHMNVIFFR
jgi:FkbM family methyltransferase